MQRFGSTLVLFGIGSIVLNLIHFEFILLMWVDMWGPAIGWGIRIAMIVLGIILWVAGKSNDGM